MPTRTLPLDDLHPAPYNPRVPLKPGDAAWVRLERSLREFSLVQPIVWNERTGHVVAGHQRVEVLRHLGHTEAECVVVDLPLEREKALNVTLNNAQVASQWDHDLLAKLLEELNDIPDFDIELTGFDQDDLKNLVFTPEPEIPDDDESEADDHITVTLEIAEADWPQVQPDLDRMLKTHRIEPHVRLPG